MAEDLNKKNLSSQILKQNQNNQQVSSQTIEKNHIKISPKTYFERYEQKNGNQMSLSLSNREQRRLQLGKYFSMIKSSEKTQSYIDWKIYKNKSDLNILPFPYCVEQSFYPKKSAYSFLSLLNPGRIRSQQLTQSKQRLPKLYNLKIQNRIKIYKQNHNDTKGYKSSYNFQKAPINQYLSYELAEQINQGLRDVQMIAEQIKKINKQKQLANQNAFSDKEKLTKGVKIKRIYAKNHRRILKNIKHFG